MSGPRNSKSLLAKGWRIITTYGFLELLGRTGFILIKALRRRRYRWDGGEFGFREAFYWGKQVDKWCRYNAVLKKINQVAKDEKDVISILEVGCGSEGLADFHPYFNSEESYKVIGIDVAVSDEALQRWYPKPFSPPLIGDGSCLPFNDNQIGFVISVDSLEHVPADKRDAYLSELVRVAKKGVVLACPMQSGDGAFAGGDYDVRYQEWHTRRFGVPNAFIVEHIEYGAPRVEELQRLPTARVHGSLNSEIWFKCMTLSARPFVGLLTGFWFLMFGKKRADQPPYYGGMLYIAKEKHTDSFA